MKKMHIVDGYDVVKSPYDSRDFTINADKDFPEVYSLEVETPIKNQGTKPTCVAHALASLVEYHNLRQHGEYAAFSTEFIYGVREFGYYVGDGMCIRDGLTTIRKYGDVYVSDCQGNNNYSKAMETVNSNIDALKDLAYPHRVSAYFKVKSADDIKTAIMNHGPVVASMTTYKNSKLVDDVYTYDPNKESGRHCILIVGWNEKGWIIQNSWGIFYGGDGKFILPFDYKFNETWGVTDDITDEINKPKRNAFLDVIYSIINKIVNFFRNLGKK